MIDLLCLRELGQQQTSFKIPVAGSAPYHGPTSVNVVIVSGAGFSPICGRKTKHLCPQASKLSPRNVEMTVNTWLLSGYSCPEDYDSIGRSLAGSSYRRYQWAVQTSGNRGKEAIRSSGQTSYIYIIGSAVVRFARPAPPRRPRAYSQEPLRGLPA